MPDLQFTIEATLEKTSGKFVSGEDLAEEIKGEIEGADPGSVSVDDSEYDVTSWSVSYDGTASEARRAARGGQSAPARDPSREVLEQLWIVLGPKPDELFDVLGAYGAARKIVADALGLDLARIDAPVQI